MSIRHLENLIRPRSVALVGASMRPGSVGQVVLANILGNGFAGAIHAVNPKPIDMPGVRWSASIEALPAAVDLAVVVTPADTVPDIIGRLGAIGCRTAVVISAGVTEASGLREAMLDAAKPYMLRVIGPNCLGVLMPQVGLNASFARTETRTGRLALISQSGALVTAILDWASAREIGFSGIVSVGDMADVDLGDLIDLFASDPETDGILLYVEGATNPGKFISAARAAARVKPVIAIKAGRTAGARKAALSHTGALAGSYEVYQGVFRRAGIVMVETLTDMFDAAETLCRTQHIAGNRLGIVTNGGGAGILAADALGSTQGVLATLDGATVTGLDARLPRGWSRSNPVDIIGDAHADRYTAAITAVLDDPAIDAVLVMYCPVAVTAPGDIATALANAVSDARGRGNRKPVLACWLGDANAGVARPILSAADIPLFNTPDDAVRGFGYLLAAKEAHDGLMGTPSTAGELANDGVSARAIIARVRADGRDLLDEVEAKALLATFGIPVVATQFAPTADAVASVCADMAGPFAVKIVSPQLSHKSDVGGVALDLADGKAAVEAARAMHERIAREHPEARIDGFAVQPMVRRPGAQEMIVGIADDPGFGPVLMVGAGGKAVELLKDRSFGLPPLDDRLARQMIAGTRISKLLAGYRDEPPADIAGVSAVLCALSTMAIELPEIAELDINPLLVDSRGVVALDARIRITADAAPPSRLVIRPIPMQWAADLVTRSGLAFHVRPVRPEDEPALAAFFTHVSPEDIRFRFLSPVREVGHERLAAMTQIDYWRTMTFLGFADDGETVIAAATLAADPDRLRAEVAISIRSELKGRGIAWTLLEHVISYAKAEGIGAIESVESADSAAAIDLEREMGFTVRPDPGDPALRIVRLELG